MPDPSPTTELDVLLLLKALHRQATIERSHFYVGAVVHDAIDEIERLRGERNKFEKAWNDVSDRYEALLDQLGATDA